MKVYISADIEGINGIVSWLETEKGDDYEYFRKQMTEEVRRACIGAHKAGATEIFVKDAHDNARNIIFKDLPDYVTLHRGWEGGPCSMMAGLNDSYDAVIFIGYHSPSRSDGNPLSHTMNTRLHHVKINGEIASEFLINSYYAAWLNVPTVFLSGDLKLTESVKKLFPEAEVVATKEGRHGAVVSRHPNITNQEIEDKVELALKKKKEPANKPISILPKKFKIEIQYKNFNDAYKASFYPGAKLIKDDAIEYETKDYYNALVMMKFLL
ncbi:MAG TPA: M55 family metallopeptidase [Bacilli bacterium]|jgi:D-amino peptidase|nr:M55 family metallopeptidase [Bacilli bacterium]HOC97479.1 M55 family metallopeptidase [Bacilli bacterium]HPA98634.1 M55 family metallopeptidase [Bacilli bacterium]HQB79764.1 M55 family metallopeptidase [Bacilli bacterium]HQM17910.1 M55 family metallopeptidase [Bacilli bacterium]